MPKLVIVESPAKAKTIGKYLGRGYKVTASMGHVRDLPASTLGIDVENGYKPKYITIKGKQKLVKELKAEAKKCDGVLLATDPDREGEAISWHLANILGLDPAAPNRVTFDEITKKGVKEGMAHPRAINIDLFNAQQARRELDRLVGYKLSPFLWKKVRRGLSAGRVQSVAVRLIRDREIEIENFKPDEYWNIDALLHPQGEKGEFTARLAATADGKKLTVTDKQQADAVLAALDGKDYTITKIEKGKRRRQPGIAKYGPSRNFHGKSPPIGSACPARKCARQVGCSFVMNCFDCTGSCPVCKGAVRGKICPMTALGKFFVQKACFLPGSMVILFGSIVLYCAL